MSGKEDCIADALSRGPVDQPTEEDILGEEASRGIRHIVRRAASCAGIDDDLQENLVDPNMEWIRDAAKRDNTYQELLATIRGGFPDKICDTSGVVRPYFGVRNDLSEHNGLAILNSCRIVVPTILRKEVLKRLHVSHQGIERTLRRARETVYWPGITADVINTVASCHPCSEQLPSQMKEHGKSPAELLFGCQLRSVVPSLQENLIPKWKADIEDKVTELQKRSERNYNVGARPLEDLQIGDRVRVQNAITKKWDEIGAIVHKGSNRDYVISIPGKRMKWRNRRFLRRFTEERGKDDGISDDITARNTELNRHTPSLETGHSSLRRSTRERKQTVQFNL